MSNSQTITQNKITNHNNLLNGKLNNSWVITLVDVFIELNYYYFPQNLFWSRLNIKHIFTQYKFILANPLLFNKPLKSVFFPIDFLK